MIETFNFLSNLPPRELYQWDEKTNQFFAWHFDGINQIGEKHAGKTKELALSKLRAANNGCK